MKLYLKQLELGPLQNFVYLVGSVSSREVAVVDPAWDVPRILQEAEADGMKISAILVTHTHFDHINGVEQMVAATDAPVWVHKKEAAALPIEKGNVREIEGGQGVSVGDARLSFLHTPGHTPGSVCLTVADRLLAGDTLFVGGCGRCDLPGGDPELLYKSLVRLSRLEDRMVLYPGHHYAKAPHARLGEEKAYNPFLAAENLDRFLSLVGGVRRRS